MNSDFNNLRIGTGFDVHAFENDRKLILGGVEIPFEKGLAGHSDADVLIHSIIDSLLGASNLGDIGILFPDNDSKYKDIDSRILLEKTKELLQKNNWKIINIDAVIVCQLPKISPHKNKMLCELSRILEIEENRISIKGKTSEKLGFTGRSEGIAAYVNSLIYKEL